MHALETLGDQGLLAVFATELDALQFARAVRALVASWIVDIVPAYSTVAIFPDLEQMSLEAAAALLRDVTVVDTFITPGLLHRIPCCYDLNLDLDLVSQHTGLSADAIVALHTSIDYTAYAIGFCPGFAYLGYLPPALSSVPRLASPRLRVEPGSVAITGRQTGVYPLPRPGGWNIIGRTPLTLVDVANGYFPIRAGDRVRFEAIDKKRYEKLVGERLKVETARTTGSLTANS